MLLKSSDFITHDLDEQNVFAGCENQAGDRGAETKYELELVLRKWYPVERARELRCFIRDGVMLGSVFDTMHFWCNR